jgi:hypothetical protein
LVSLKGGVPSKKFEAINPILARLCEVLHTASRQQLAAQDVRGDI